MNLITYGLIALAAKIPWLANRIQIVESPPMEIGDNAAIWVDWMCPLEPGPAAIAAHIVQPGEYDVTIADVIPNTTKAYAAAKSVEFATHQLMEIKKTTVFIVANEETYFRMMELANPDERKKMLSSPKTKAEGECWENACQNFRKRWEKMRRITHYTIGDFPERDQQALDKMKTAMRGEIIRR